MKDFMTSVSLYVNRFVNFLMKLCLAVGIILCIVMVISTLGQVIARVTDLFVFESSEEISRFSMCWLAMLGSAVALRQGRHLGVRLLVDHLPAGLYDRVFAPLIQLVMLVFFIFVTVKGWEFAMRGTYQVSPSMFLPMVYPYLCLPVGGAIMALNVLSDILQDRFPTEAGSTAQIASTVTDNMQEIESEMAAGTDCSKLGNEKGEKSC